MVDGAKTEQFANEILERGLSYEDIQCLWHATSWHLVESGVNNRTTEIKIRMIKAICDMPL